MPSRRLLRLASLLMVVGLLLAGAAVVRAQDPPLHAGPPFLISSMSGQDRYPALAYNPTAHLFLVVWEEDGGGIAGSVVSESGTVVALQFSINGMFGYVGGTRPAVAYDRSSATFLVVWSQLVGGPAPHTDIYAQRFAGDGQTNRGNFWVSFTGGAFAPQVAAGNNDRDYLVVWQSNGTIHGQRVWGDSGGANLWGSRITVAQQTTGVGYDIWHSQPDAAYNASQNRFLVVYTRQNPPVDPNARDIYGRLVNGDGTMPFLSTVVDGSANAQYEPALAAYPLRPASPFLVVYNDEYDGPPDVDVTALLLDPNGVTVSGYLCVACNSTYSEAMPDVAAGDGFGYTIVWQEYNAGTWNTWGRRATPDATLQQDFIASAWAGAQQVPALAGGSPVALMTWQDDGWGSLTFDVVGRVLGHRAGLPVVRR